MDHKSSSEWLTNLVGAAGRRKMRVHVCTQPTAAEHMFMYIAHEYYRGSVNGEE